MGVLTVEDIQEWPEIGDTYNDDWGVDDVRAKLINGEWAYVQLEWRYKVASTGFIFYAGKQLEELRDLPTPHIKAFEPPKPSTYTCARCGLRFRTTNQNVGCLVMHLPGTCCHYTDVEITSAQTKEEKENND